MRKSLIAIAALFAASPALLANDLRFFDDAALRAVQFMEDGQEGWAVGDEGVIWHTIDGGKSWDRQNSSTRASLRSVHFLNALVGFAVGREELPLGAGSAGVILLTTDSGETWQHLSLNSLPGLNAVRFLDEKVGYAAGDGSDQHPSGVFVTRDSGKTWQPVAGPRVPSWNAFFMANKDQGAFVGAWSRLANLKAGQIVLGDADFLGGMGVRSIYRGSGEGARSIAVGQGSLVLVGNELGNKFHPLKIGLPQEVRSCWDLHAVHGAGEHVWAAGRPGSVLLHSPDQGKTWELTRTGQPLPLHGLWFKDEKTGWAVGELGLILKTVDGGKTWKAQRQGGKRAGLFCASARPGGLPLGVMARVMDDGWLSASLNLISADAGTAPPSKAVEGERLLQAVRQTGGAASEQGWQMPLPVHLARETRESILEKWDDLHGGKADEQLLRQLVLAIRMWRPEVVVGDALEQKGAEFAVDALVAEALREAFKRAADPNAFPEQIKELGLREWKAAKLYGMVPEGREGPVALNLSEVRPRFVGTIRDFITPAANLLAGKPVVLPKRQTLQLLASHLAGAEKHVALFEGVRPSPLGDARRKLPACAELTAEMTKAIQAQQNLQTLIDQPAAGWNQPERMLATMPKLLEALPDGQAPLAAHAMASQMARLGQWHLAREMYLQMLEKYPAHPLTADAYRWLIKHGASSEARRRHELGQFLVMGVVTQTSPRAVKMEAKKSSKNDFGKGKKPEVKVEGSEESSEQSWDIQRPEARKLTMQWHQSSLELAPKLAGFGALLSEDPAMQFSLHAARRNLGDYETSRQWFAEFQARQPAGPWRDAAAAELWLTRPQGAPPKPLLLCRQTDNKPFLDGKFDDACWKDLAPAVLQNAVGATGSVAPTKVWMTYDNDFLYLALRCEHPEGKQVVPVKGRKRDDDLRNFDRVSLLLDLDRDYSTYFHLQIDQRGCVRESCWGDVSWNPRWFSAVQSDATSWQIEAAIPLSALTGDMITSSKAWACNVIRTLPGQGVQALSLPAGVPEDDPRPEGMGLLLFKQEAGQSVPRRVGGLGEMPKVTDR